jgi:hypothetical protein
MHVIWTSWAHVWRLRSLFLGTGCDRIFLSIFYFHMIHTSMSLILPCWSSRVGDAVGSLIYTLNYTQVRLLLWTPVSKMPILPTDETGFPCYGTLSNVVSLRCWWCRARRLEVVALNLPFWSLKSLTCSLHSQLPTLLTQAEIRSLRGRTNKEPCVASLRSSVLHLPFAFYDSSPVFQD